MDTSKKHRKQDSVMAYPVAIENNLRQNLFFFFSPIRCQYCIHSKGQWSSWRIRVNICSAIEKKTREGGCGPMGGGRNRGVCGGIPKGSWGS